MDDREPGQNVVGPERASRPGRDASAREPGTAAAGGAIRRGSRGHPRSVLAWARAQPVLATALLGFCLVASAGLVLSVPRGMWSGRSVGGAHVSTPVAPLPPKPETADPGPAGASGGPPPSAEARAAGAWVEADVPAASPRGVALVYRYRTLPPGGESRYEWVVQVRGPEPVLDGIDVVNWRMEPAAKNGADFVSRDRAADGFPLLGHGPGGWFGVSATIRYQDGGEETLTRRIELSE